MIVMMIFSGGLEILTHTRVFDYIYYLLGHVLYDVECSTQGTYSPVFLGKYTIKMTFVSK